MNPDGSDLSRLTGDDHHYWDPVFSSDGSLIACVIAHPIYEERHDICLMNADGTDQRTLTSSHRDIDPVISPDGREIAFVSGRDRIAGVDILHVASHGYYDPRVPMASGLVLEDLLSRSG